MIAILFELVEASDADTSDGQRVVMMAEGGGVVVVVVVVGSLSSSFVVFVVFVVVVVRSRSPRSICRRYHHL